MEFDLVVIGAGSGGVRAARMSASLGAKVAIVEERFFGGTCVNVGCVPKKLFSFGSDFPGNFKLAEDYGYNVENWSFDWDTLRENKHKEIARLNGIYQRILDNAGVEIFEGHGTVCEDGKVRVGEQVLQAKKILIAVGGKPFVPDFPGSDLVSISDDLFYLPALPKKAVVVGGGYIATEFAGILHGLGCKVTQVYRGPLFLRGFDDDIREFVAEQMRHSGVTLKFDTDIAEITAQGEGREITYRNGDKETADAVFYATGRVPKLDDLFDLDVAPALNAQGAIEVNDQFETSVANVFAVGDVIGRVALTPVALAEGMWLAHQWFAPQEKKPTENVSYEMIPTAVFSHPNIGTIGLTEQQALAQYGTVQVYKSRFRPMRYSLGDNQVYTLMKLIVDEASDKVVGLHMAGEEAAEITQGFAVAMKMGATKADFDATIGIHPSSAEEWVTLRDGERVQAS